MGRRDSESNERVSIPRGEFVLNVAGELDEIQAQLFARAKAFKDEHTRCIDSKDEFYDFFTPANKEKPEVHGGFALAHWSGESDVEEKIKDDLNVTIRCIPQDAPEEDGQCIISGKPSKRRVVFAKSY